MHAAPQFARMVDERGVEVQQDYESLTSASELLPLNGKSDRVPEQRLGLNQQQSEGTFVQQRVHFLPHLTVQVTDSVTFSATLQGPPSEVFGHLAFCLVLVCLPWDL